MVSRKELGAKKKITNYELTFNVMAIGIGVNFPNMQVPSVFHPFLVFISV